MASATAGARNFWLGVANGVLVNGGEAFLHSGLVMAPFLAALGAPPVVVGLVPAIRVGLWFLPQLFVANRLAQEPLKLKYYHLTSTLRSIALIVLTTSVFLLSDRHPTALIAIVLLMITINALVGGIGGIPWADVTAKVVPHSRLGTFWALRNAVGGVLALGAGLVLRRLLDSDIAFPTNFAVAFAIGTLLLMMSYTSFSFVKEPPGVVSDRQSLGGMFRRIPGLLREDASLRRYLRVRFIGLTAILAEPFYGLHAILNLGAPASALGLYVVATTAVSVVANFALRVPADRGRNVTVLQVGYLFVLLAPLAAVLISDWRAYSLVFMFASVGTAAVSIAAWNLLYALAPAGERALYIGLSNTVLALPSLAPIVAGSVAMLLGYTNLFWLAALLAAVTLAFSFRFSALRELDKRALTSGIAAESERLAAEERLASEELPAAEAIGEARGDGEPTGLEADR